MNDFINNNLDSKDKDKDKFRNKNLHIKNYSDCFYNSSYNDAVKNQKDLPLEEDYNFYIQDNVPIFGKEIIEMGFVDIYYGLMQILEKCSCRFIIKEGNIDIKFIFKDRDNSEKILEYETLSKALAKNERDFSFGEYHTLYVNGVKLMNYIEQIKQYINKNKICNNFDIKLEVIENEDNNDIKNIKAIYSLTLNNGKIIYEDEDILKNGIGKGFNDFMEKIISTKTLKDVLEKLDINQSEKELLTEKPVIAQNIIFNEHNNDEILENLVNLINIQNNSQHKDTPCYLNKKRK